MLDFKALVNQTAKTAAFAFKEFFRPVVVLIRTFKSSSATTGSTAPVSDKFMLERKRNPLDQPGGSAPR